MTTRQKKGIAIACFIAFLFVSIAVCWFVGKPLLQFASEPERFREWVDSNGIWGRIAFIGMIVMQVFIAIIPGEPLEIGAGYAFGAFEGTLLCMIGAIIGSALIFAFERKFGVKAGELFFSKEKVDSLYFLQNTKQVNLLVFIIFFIPGTPKDILSYCVGLTKMKFHVWLIISSVARIPSVITSTVGGDALGVGNHLFAGIVFASTLLLSAAGLLIFNRICKAHETKEKKNDQNAALPPPDNAR